MQNSYTTTANSYFDAAVDLLLQGETFLNEVSDSEYCRAVPEVFNATIGGHYRHVLEHFQLVLAAHPGGFLEYHRRDRDRETETSVRRALQRTREMVRAFREIEFEPDSAPVEVHDTLADDPEALPQSCTSSIEREILYAVHHAVHHFALIRVMGEPMGLRFPEGFGVAASTRHHQNSLESKKNQQR